MTTPSTPTSGPSAGPSAATPAASAAARPTYTFEWLLELLQRMRWITPEQRRELEVQGPAQRARVQKQVESNNDFPANYRYTVSPAELVASFRLADARGGEVDEDRLAELLANKTGLAYRKIDPLELDMQFVTRVMSRPFALRRVVLPLEERSGTLFVAIDNPFDVELLEELRRLHPGGIERIVTSKRDILKSITEIYGFRKSVESAAREASEHVSGDFEQLVRLSSVADAEATDTHVVNAVDFLFRYAFDQRASDIHIEPRRGDSQVRLRIDGVLHNVHTIPRRVHPAIVSRLKTVARMDIAEKRRPQDGRIKTQLGDKEVELRVSTLPVAFGEKVVIRIFDPNVLEQDIVDLGFDPADLATFERWIAKPHGLILITGPTGSGKTTTLYTTLRRLADDTLNITTVEDPIELITERFNQVAAQPKIGVDFASCMRSILRQDPDIIMVGEIRDRDTAEMAVQAALTGHLVFSTLHTNDCVGAVTRLVDLGVEPFLVRSTLVGIMAQRLVRRICASCKAPVLLTSDQLRALGVGDAEREAFRGACEGTGCIQCRGTGYVGRVGVFELLRLDEELSTLLQKRASEDELRAAAIKQGMRTLRACALDRLAHGVTSFDEVVRTTGLAGA